MAEVREEVLQDLADIARTANDPNTTNMTPRLPASDNNPDNEHNMDIEPLNPVPNRSLEDTSLSARDRNAVQYTKSQLQEGDTLVVVRFPNDTPVYDATGFPLSDTHRVHSDRLKAASPRFKELLEDDWQQHKFKRRYKQKKSIPVGINYILDLTPPEEGDEALELTANLSCSLGIRRWWKTQFSECKVSRGMVGGEDETAVRPSDKKKEAHTDSSFGTSQPEQMATVKLEDDDPDIAAVLKKSKKLYQGFSSQQNNTISRTHIQDQDILDYCPIRHRTGIERLLQVIEGKDPRLDSAPKVWTLAVLANFFKCPEVVVDYIVTWMIAEPNCKIFEILPEDALRIGLLLKNITITRFAFTILVSEEALSVGTAKHDLELSIPNSSSKRTTKFGRAKESLDEDTLNSIQHAGRNFHARIEHGVQLLLDPAQMWLQALPEFAKVLSIKSFIETLAEPFDALLEEKRLVIAKVYDGLMNFTRGRILWCYYQPLDEYDRRSWFEHRNQEQHVTSSSSTEIVYYKLEESERIMTRFYWVTLRLLKWNANHPSCSTNLIRDNYWLTKDPNRKYQEKGFAAADALNIPRISYHSLQYDISRLNDLIVTSITDASFNGGNLPEVVYQESDSHLDVPRSDPVMYDEPVDSWDPMGSYSKPAFWKQALAGRDEAAPGTSKKITDNSLSQGHSISASLPPRFYPTFSPSLPSVPRESDIGPTSPFFSLSNLFDQIDDHIQRCCNAMLSRGELDRPSICDTLLCLSDEEYKYLPLWANGLDDGSGGVYEMDVPLADRGGPVGPGPAYHTGSTVNSRASTEVGFDDDISLFGSANTNNFNTSIGVEDGYSVNHIDRRRVFSESDFPTPAGSSMSESSYDHFDDATEIMYTDLPIRDKGKGKEKVVVVGDDSDGTFATPDSRTDEEIEQAVLLASFSTVNHNNSSSSHTGAPSDSFDADTFFNVPNDNPSDFEFEEDSDDGDETETEN